jgi:hypothetical protein
MSTCSGLAIFRAAAGRTRCELRRIEVCALRLLDGSVHSAGADLAAAAQQNRNILQECVTALDRQRPGGGHHGVEFGIG